jgi:AcrR family transcriptional regulator
MDQNVSSRIAQRRRAAKAEGAADYLARRQELVRTAALVFREKGYRAATLNDVAEKFGTDRASLYYYIGSKEELFQECVQGVLDENLERGRQIAATNMGAREKLEMLVEIVLRSYSDNYPYMFLYIQEDMSRITSQDTEWAAEMATHTKRLETVFLDIIREGVAERSFRPDLRAGLVANGLFGMMNWTHRWYVPGMKVTPAEMAKTFTSIFFDGFSMEDR